MTSKPPILVLGKTGRVYVITHYTYRPGGECIPLVKFDVTGQFDYICQKKFTTDPAPPEGTKGPSAAPSP